MQTFSNLAFFCFYFYDDAEIIQILRTVHVRFCVSAPFVFICHLPFVFEDRKEFGVCLFVIFWRISTLANLIEINAKKKSKF